MTRRLEVDRDIVTDEFAFLEANAHARAKYTIPAPSWHRLYWHPEYSTDAYPTSDDFIADVARILREHVVDRLVELGCDYIQIDAPNYAQWHIDPANRAAFEEHGHDMAHELVADAEFDSMVFEGLDGCHPRDAHVPRECPRRNVGRDRRLRGDLEAGLPAPARTSTGCCSSTTPTAPVPSSRSPTSCRVTRSCSGSSPRRTGRLEDPEELVARVEEATQVRAARTARDQPPVRLRVGGDRRR